MQALREAPSSDRSHWSCAEPAPIGISELSAMTRQAPGGVAVVPESERSGVVFEVAEVGAAPPGS